jgi:hypothetical protein
LDGVGSRSLLVSVPYFVTTGVFMDDSKPVDSTLTDTSQYAAKLAHILDMQGLAALLAHVCYDRLVLKSIIDMSGFPSLTEDQIFMSLVNGLHSTVEDVELGPSDAEVVSDSIGPSNVVFLKEPRG